MGSLETFCRQVRARSAEHREAIRLLQGSGVLSQMIAILRQELDSMVRVIFLISIADKTYRDQLLDASVNGEKWTIEGKSARVTDRQMVDLAQSLQGWTQSVYKFGCAFIHLSNFHDYGQRDPLSTLSSDEKANLLRHMRYYNGDQNVATAVIFVTNTTILIADIRQKKNWNGHRVTRKQSI